MFTHKDIENRTIFVVNCLQHERIMRVVNGELLLEKKEEEKKTTLTKIPFQKVLALFIIGHITITTPLIEKCKKHGVALVVLKPNLRPVFFWAEPAEGNFLLRKRQHTFPLSDTTIANILIANKIENQLNNLQKTRRKDPLTQEAINICNTALDTIATIDEPRKTIRIGRHRFQSIFLRLFPRIELERTIPQDKKRYT